MSNPRIAGRILIVLSVLALLMITGCKSDDPVAPTSTGTIEIKSSPVEITGSWVLAGPDDFEKTGDENQTITNLTTGEYSISWGNVEGWVSPGSETSQLGPGEVVTFSGVYQKMTPTWTLQNSGTQVDLNAVFALNENECWAVGDGGIILYTSDGGVNWQAQTSGTSLALSDIQFVDQNTGWVAGGVVLKTTDGGATWVEVPDVAGEILSFVDDQTGWIVNSDTANSTADGGNTWLPGSLGLDQNEWTVAASFVDKFTGWVSVWDLDNFWERILITRNGGMSWTVQETPVESVMWGMDFFDSQNGWAVGHESILRFDPQSSTWGVQPSGLFGTYITLMDVDFISPSFGCAVGDGGTVMMTTNGGANWLPNQSEAGTRLDGVSLASENGGWAVGSGGTIVHLVWQK